MLPSQCTFTEELELYKEYPVHGALRRLGLDSGSITLLDVQLHIAFTQHSHSNLGGFNDIITVAVHMAYQQLHSAPLALSSLYHLLHSLYHLAYHPWLTLAQSALTKHDSLLCHPLCHPLHSYWLQVPSCIARLIHSFHLLTHLPPYDSF